MNVIWIVADTFRQDHLGAYGNPTVRTPSLDALAAKSVRFDRHYASGFPTMPTRAAHFTGRWTISFMDWEPLPEEVTTLAQMLSANGIHTAASVDTPFYIRQGFNYDRGFQTFFFHPGQEGSPTRVLLKGHHESRDVKEVWRHESDRNAPQTISRAMEWLERHYKEHFFLYVDTWDPHEPWDAPPYYTEPFWPGYDGEVIQPVYGHWQDSPGMTEEKVRKAHATYMGEIGMVDAWIGQLLRRVENMGLMNDTAIIFTSDHGFYFGEHGGLFGKMTFNKKPDGSLYKHGEPETGLDYSPLFEELVRVPLLVYVPAVEPGVYGGLTSAVDVMPTVLEILAQEGEGSIEGESLLPRMRDTSLKGREFVVSTLPFANPGETSNAFDSISRELRDSPVTTITAGHWSLLYSMGAGMSALHDLEADPRQETNVISKHPELAGEMHQYLLKLMSDTGAPEYLVKTRLELKL